MPALAIQYPSFGPQHPPRLKAISSLSPSGWRVVAMEMYARDSDYPWNQGAAGESGYARMTVCDADSASGRRHPDLRRMVMDALDGLAPDVLVVNGWGHIESRHSLAWARRHRCPSVLLSDTIYENVHRYWWKEAFKRWVIRNCSSAFVAGTPQARYVQRLGISRSRIFHPGSCVVDNEWWKEMASIARRAAGTKPLPGGLPKDYFLFVGRFIECKNLIRLIRAYAEFRRDSAEARHALVLVGQGTEESAIREIIRNESVPDVVFTGPLQPEALAGVYARATCLVLPSSHTENWGLVVNEAMACGIPVLVSRMVGCAEDLVREGVNGYVFDPHDTRRLAERLGALAGDPELRASMGRSSEAIIDGYSCEVAAKQLWRSVESALH